MEDLVEDVAAVVAATGAIEGEVVAEDDVAGGEAMVLGFGVRELEGEEEGDEEEEDEDNGEGDDDDDDNDDDDDDDDRVGDIIGSAISTSWTM